MDESALLAGFVPGLPQHDGVLLGPGDDSAVVAATDGRLTVSTDILVEGVHFRRAWSSPFDLGWRLAAQNLADAAAMGAAPKYLVAALSGPPDSLTPAFLNQFAAGLAGFCDRHGTAVVGGDLSAGPQLTLCATVLGDLAGRPPVTRSGARPGDIVALHDAAPAGSPNPAPWRPPQCPTHGSPPPGRLGRSAAGLACLTAGLNPADLAPDSVEAAAISGYLRPDPDIGQGRLAALAGATAMLDVSDSLTLDAERLAQASGVQIWLDSEAAPIQAALDQLAPLAARLGAQATGWVWGGGEDHALLATFPAEAPLPEGWSGIGQVREAGETGPGVDGPVVSGWDHLAPS
ncbi:MAG: thiamine-phosphate kinase [Bifidobacteriaceae bacterium]|jgi:thiamine-monophosphate kinase|nr:thiamine-phosphate kinase [Bifidobacteriaceae bacterium]